MGAKKIISKQVVNAASAVAMAVLVAGCGGGGATPRPPVTTPPPPPPPPPPPVVNPSDFHTKEFSRSWGLKAIGADWAYAEGYTGKGVILGVLDFNFDLDSTELDVHPASRDKDPDMVAIYEAQIGEEAPQDPHGHAVAVVMAGLKNNTDTHGVAFESQVLLVDYFSGVDQQTQTYNGVDYIVSNPYGYLARKGARAVNISIGYDEEDIISNPPTVDTKYVNADAGNAILQGLVLVASAGNAGHDEPMLSNLAILDEADRIGALNGPGAFIIVGAVDENLEMADFSDKAGRAKDIYLVAPGVEVVAPWTVDGEAGLYYLGGTSFAAPHVTGALGILLSRWPFMTGRQVAQILFDTATDLGAPGVDEVFGHGLLNLRNAIAPQGQVTVAIAGSANAFTPSDVAVVFGQAFGDAAPSGLNSVLGLDRYGRDFYFDLSGGVRNMAGGMTPLSYFLDHEKTMARAGWRVGNGVMSLYLDQDMLRPSFMAAQPQSVRDRVNLAPVRGGLLQGQFTDNWSWQAGAGFGLQSVMNTRHQADTVRLVSGAGRGAYLSANGHFALVSHALSENRQLRMGFEVTRTDGIGHHYLKAMTGDTPRYSAVVEVTQDLHAGRFGLRIGNMVEKSAILGSRSAGGFRLGGDTNTTFAGLGGELMVGPFNLSARVETGISRVKGAGVSYFAGLNDFISSSWAVKLGVQDAGLRGASAVLSVAQPLRVENAHATIIRADRLDATTGAVLYEQGRVNLVPTGREVALEAAWRLQRGSWAVQTSLLSRFDAGHMKGQRDTAALLWVQRRF